jgi:hypothetical protein
MLVDRLQVGEIETAFQWCLRQLIRTGRHQCGFDLFKGLLIGNIETIF